MHIYLDGIYIATTGIEKWFTCGYHEGDEIDEQQWSELYAEIYFDKIYNSALNLLSQRDHSRKELSDKLYQKFVINPFVAKDIRESETDMQSFKTHGIDKEIVGSQIGLVCDKLEELSLLDDLRYAKLYADELKRTKKLGMEGIKTALIKRGINRDIIADVCDNLELDGVETIKEILRTRYRNADLYDEAIMNRIFGKLERKGYRLMEIKQAYHDYLEYEYEKIDCYNIDESEIVYL